MGDRSHLSLALVAAALLAGCVDFAAPPIPNAGAPAIAQLSVNVLDNGSAFVSGSIQPGRDSSGVTRVPLDSTLFVAGRAVEPDTILPRNTLQFAQSLQLTADELSQPITVVAPAIAGIQAPAPSVSWWGMEKLDPGVVTVTRGEDLRLHVRTRRGESVPAVQSRQWFLDLAGPTGVFRVSSNGFPPDTLRIPTQWLPIPETGDVTIFVSMIYYQSAQLRPPPGDYIGLISIDSRASWTVQVR